jgi:hypothetical protein
MDLLPIDDALDAVVALLRERARRAQREGEPLPTAARALDGLDRDFTAGVLTREEYDRQRQGVVAAFLDR